MPTYRTSARNQFRTPSGAVGDAPDGPGGMAALSDDVDAYLGVGGAEYCATTLDSVAPGRKFKGKLAYHAPSDVTYRYMGVGLTTTGGGASWQAWEKPPAAFSPSFLAGMTAPTAASTAAFWGISAGRFWMEVSATWVAAGTLSGEVTVGTPSPIIGNMCNGSGIWFQGGGTGNGQTVDLSIWSAGVSDRVRMRVKTIAVATAGTPVRDYVMNQVGLATAANDYMLFSVSGPSGLTY